MKQTTFKRFLSAFLCMVLIAAMALTATGCSHKLELGAGQETAIEIGSGETQFYFTVIDTEGVTKWYDVTTDKTTVGDALLELDLITGEDSAYGLYVKTVDGITLDYDKDGKYWAFYINGEYASSGVDTTDIASGETYTFKAE